MGVRAMCELRRRGRRLGPGLRLLAGACVLAAVAGLAGNLAGCGRGGDVQPVGHTVSGTQDILLLAPGGHLRLGKNTVELRLTQAANQQPLDVVAHLDFVLGVAGSAPVRIPVDLAKTAPGAFTGKVLLDVPGPWWGEVTFNGIEGTQTVRVRVSVGR